MPLPSISTLIALTLSIAGHCVHQPYPVSVNLESADCQLLTLHLMSYVRKCSVRDLYSDTAPEKVWIQVPCSWTLLLYFVSRFRVQGVVVSVDLTNSSLILGDCTPLLQRLITVASYRRWISDNNSIFSRGHEDAQSARSAVARGAHE